jgi:hypothetical protein
VDAVHKPGIAPSTDNRRRWLALLVLCLGVLMIVLDTTIVNVALPSGRGHDHGVVDAGRLCDRERE